MKRIVKVLGLCGVVLGASAVASPAWAQSGGAVEIGASLAQIAVVIPPSGGSGVIAGVPSATFNLISPSVYAAIFAGPKFAVEPQVGLIVFHGGGDNGHLLNFSGQFDYFVEGTKVSSPYVFGTVGVLSASGLGTTPATFGGGAGYRVRAGDRLVLRVSGSVNHFTSHGGNMVVFGVSIGGLFGK